MIKKLVIYLPILVLSLMILSLLPARLSSGEVYGVTCADGTNHPPGFDCEEYMREKMGTETPREERRVSPVMRQQQLEREQEFERQRQQRLEREQELEWERLRQQQLREAEERKKREEARRKQFEQDKQEALNMLKSGTGRMGLKTGADDGPGIKDGSASDLKLKGIEPAGQSLKDAPFSKGTKSSAPVQLKSVHSSRPPVVSPEQLKGDVDDRKGLRTNYVPKPSLGSLEDYHYDKKERTDIILDALEVGRGSYIESVRHLEDYLTSVDPGNIKVQEALSYIQGMAEGEFLQTEMEKKPGPFDPSPDDSRALLEADSVTLKRTWPGRTVNPELDQPLTNPLDWRSVRDTAIVETFDLLPEGAEEPARDDWQRCIRSLEKRGREHPDVNGYTQALQFFKGVITHYDLPGD